MDLQTIQPVIRRYIDNVAKQIHIEDVLLYGSIAEQMQTEDSDVDLLVLSDDFSSMDADERSRLLYRASVGFPYDLHVYGVTQSELYSASSLTTLGQIKKSKTISIL